MTLTVAFLASFLFAGPLLAQEQEAVLPKEVAARAENPLSLRMGSRIRLHAPSIDGPWVDGRVIDFDGSSFAFTIEGRPRVIYMRDYQDLYAIDVRRRLARPSASAGALWGLYLGTTMGMIAGPFAAKEMTIGTGMAVAAFGGGGALLGAVTGAATGAILAPGRWYRHIFE